MIPKGVRAPNGTIKSHFIGLFCEASTKIPSWLVSFMYYPSEHRLSITSLSSGPLQHSINQRIFSLSTTFQTIGSTDLRENRAFTTTFSKKCSKNSQTLHLGLLIFKNLSSRGQKKIQSTKPLNYSSSTPAVLPIHKASSVKNLILKSTTYNNLN